MKCLSAENVQCAISHYNRTKHFLLPGNTVGPNFSLLGFLFLRFFTQANAFALAAFNNKFDLGGCKFKWFQRKLQQKIRGQGFFSLFEFYYFGRRGNPLFHRRNYFWAAEWRLCLSAWRATTFCASHSWYRTVTIAKATLLLPPGSIPENTVKGAENWFSVCWERNVILGFRTPWASSPSWQPWGLAQLFVRLQSSPWFFQRIHVQHSHPHYQTPFPRKVQLV